MNVLFYLWIFKKANQEERYKKKCFSNKNWSSLRLIDKIKYHNFELFLAFTRVKSTNISLYHMGRELWWETEVRGWCLGMQQTIPYRKWQLVLSDQC
jgi:hypothetical protein